MASLSHKDPGHLIWSTPLQTLQATEGQTEELRGHVIIAGFGRVGQIIGQLLAERLIPFVAVDVRMDCVQVQMAFLVLQAYRESDPIILQAPWSTTVPNITNVGSDRQHHACRLCNTVYSARVHVYHDETSACRPGRLWTSRCTLGMLAAALCCTAWEPSMQPAQ